MQCLTRTLALAPLLLLVPALAAAQTSGADGAGAAVFAYQPKQGQQERFEAGYRSHLEWHRAQEDSLNWLGWTVLAGPRLGAFVDGVFGIDYGALDARVDPAGDAAHMAAEVTPHATPITRHLLRARPELSTASLAEDGAPTPLVQVTRYEVAPGHLDAVENALRALRNAADATALLPYTVYELGAGAQPGFLLMTWRTRFASFDNVAGDPNGRLQPRLAEAASAAGVPGALVTAVESEVWQYRPDLTYLAEEQ